MATARAARLGSEEFRRRNFRAGCPGKKAHRIAGDRRDGQHEKSRGADGGDAPLLYFRKMPEEPRYMFAGHGALLYSAPQKCNPLCNRCSLHLEGILASCLVTSCSLFSASMPYPFATEASAGFRSSGGNSPWRASGLKSKSRPPARKPG